MIKLWIVIQNIISFQKVGFTPEEPIWMTHHVECPLFHGTEFVINEMSFVFWPENDVTPLPLGYFHVRNPSAQSTLSQDIQ